MYAYALYNFGNAAATTMAFVTISFAELFHAFNVRRERRSAFGKGALANKVLLATVALGVLANVALCLSPLSAAFGIAALTPLQWLCIFALSLSVIPFMELYKLAAKLIKKRR